MDYKVSIIIPIYNVEPYILECLQSVSNQTIQEGLECILVDDCGTDGSVRIAELFLKTYQGKIRFELVRHEKNGGLSAARNTGIRASHGEYLYFLDSDDTIIPNCIELLFHLADKHKADLVIGFYETEDDRMSQFDKIDYPEFVSDKGQIKRMLLDYDYLPVTAANRLVRRELFTKKQLFFKEGIIHEDNYWTFFLAKHVDKLVICHKKVYNYRLTPGSITHKVNRPKEMLAFRTMIVDFSNNIDDIEKGAQKRDIFCLLLSAIDSLYYHDERERSLLISTFKKQNGLILRMLLSVVFVLKSNFYLRNKTINLLMKIFESDFWLCRYLIK